ncbi:hypothetical protein Tco_0753459 [Tanacetum coccineum]
MPFYKSTTPNTRISNEKVNIVKVNGVNIVGQTAVSTVKGTGVTAVKASASETHKDNSILADDESGLKSMQDVLLQFKIQKFGPRSTPSSLELYETFSYPICWTMDSSGDFDQIMHKRFQMSSMGELTFFLGYKSSRKRIGSSFARTTFSDSDYAGSSLDRKSTTEDHEADKVIHKEGGDNVERTITTASSLDAAQDNGSPRRQDTMGGTLAQTMSEREVTHPRRNLRHLDRLNSKNCKKKLSTHVLDLEKEKDAQAVEILILKKRVQRLERQRKSSTYQPRRRKYRHVESSDDDLNKEDASKQRRSIHTLFMDGTPMEINMLVEKKYPLVKELLEKMLNLQLEAEEESIMAFELINFIKSMLEE